MGEHVNDQESNRAGRKTLLIAISDLVTISDTCSHRNYVSLTVDSLRRKKSVNVRPTYEQFSAKSGELGQLRNHCSILDTQY
jgi:hypothetical protein